MDELDEKCGVIGQIVEMLSSTVRPALRYTQTVSSCFGLSQRQLRRRLMEGGRRFSVECKGLFIDFLTYACSSFGHHVICCLLRVTSRSKRLDGRHRSGNTLRGCANGMDDDTEVLAADRLMACFGRTG